VHSDGTGVPFFPLIVLPSFVMAKYEDWKTSFSIAMGVRDLPLFLKMKDRHRRALASVTDWIFGVPHVGDPIYTHSRSTYAIPEWF